MEAKNSAAAILNRNGESSGRSLLSQFSNDEFTNPEYESRFHGENSLITSLSLFLHLFSFFLSHTKSEPARLLEKSERKREKKKTRQQAELGGGGRML